MTSSNRRARFLPRTERWGPFSQEVSGTAEYPGETRPRRNVKAVRGLIARPDPSIGTAYDIVRYSATKYGDAQCMGWRTLKGTHTETKKVTKTIDGETREVDKDWTYFELSGYTYMSFNEFQTLVDELGSGLKSMGLDKGDKIVLYGATSMKWMSMAHGAFTQSLTIVTAYDTLGIDGLRSALATTKSKAIFIDHSLTKMLAAVLKDVSTLEYIILDDTTPLSSTTLSALKSANPSIQITTYNHLRTQGQTHPSAPNPPSPTDLACIMYTSGSSGTPKGVTIKHSAVAAAVAGAHSVVGAHIAPQDRLLAYLPLAHIIEFVFENAALFWGATLGYASPRTLTDASVRRCRGDLAEFRPTIMVGVPAVWEMVRKAVVGRVNAQGAVARGVFWGALYAKQFLVASGLPGAGLLDAVVFERVREATGGKLRLCMVGGGPVARETQVFLSYALAPMIAGYALTETAGMGALTDPLAWTADAVGEIPCSVEVKLVDFPEAGYLTSSTPPQGELWIRGPAVTEGYYENEEETRAAIKEDGWFLTGDIAEFDAQGRIRIIDRKKNLVKTLKGEYIALEKLESVYRASTLVSNICIHAAQDRNQPIAIIVPTEAALRKLATDNGIAWTDLDGMVLDRKLNELVLQDLQAVGRQGRLSSLEMIDGVVMDKDEWTPQNGYVTATQKLQRKKILEKNKDVVDQLFSGTNA